MGLRINTNVAAISAQKEITKTSRDLEKVVTSLASGSQFGHGGGRAGDHAIAEGLRGQIKGMEGATKNAESAISFIQVAEGGLNEQNNILIRMRELAIQAASDTVGDTEREMIHQEFSQIGAELDRIAKTTTFGSAKLLSGENREFEFQVGANKGEENVIKYRSDQNTTASELNIDSARVGDRSDARDSLDTIDEALTKVSRARASFGAVQSRLESTVNNGYTQVANLTEAHSRLADTDVAKAVSDMYRLQVMQQYQVQVLGEANRWTGQALKLIG